jgi:anti-repressor protein|uniref:KilAC domain protein n=1 Tax=Siphoviridae sp. ctEkS11 TaxID=2827272 RepID=A0A8S5R4N5_9CAUD|nr:MAG TPA: KilAC domain protein [Siphoviridae sp. ctEkS11]DAV77152.1 MAG TPA: KilAC domain protein [Caudoviricetes sp.]
MSDIFLTNENGQIVTSSRDVAEKFNKNHKEVLRSISNISEKISTAQFCALFFLNEYKASNGKKNKEYLMNRDGFSLLCMGFTGEEALSWKLKYINAFNYMEERLKSGNQLTEEEKLKLQLFSKDASEVAYAHNRLVELATAPLNAKIEEQKPKVEFHDSVAVSENCVSFGKFAGSFQNTHKSFGRNKIMDWCRNEGYLCSSYGLKNKPSQQMLEYGYMQYKENTNECNGKIHITYTPLLTGKGQIWLTKKLNEYLN